MGLEQTVLLLILGLVVTGVSNWLSRKEYQPGQLPLLPYNGLQFIGMLIVFLTIAHLITILTGQPFKGRMG